LQCDLDFDFEPRSVAAEPALRFCGGSPVALPERVPNVLRGDSEDAALLEALLGRANSLLLVARPKGGADDHANAMYFLKNLVCLPRV
jgi:hypothetical protein